VPYVNGGEHGIERGDSEFTRFSARARRTGDTVGLEGMWVSRSKWEMREGWDIWEVRKRFERRRERVQGLRMGMDAGMGRSELQRKEGQWGALFDGDMLG
jgi:hypothetical protein